MRTDKYTAEILRKNGKSYSEISKKLNIPKSTLSNWFSSNAWSKNIKEKLTLKANYASKERLQIINKRRQKVWNQKRREMQKEAVSEFPKLKNNPLFIAGLMLYWGEGDNKAKNPFRISNTDPRMIVLYVKFLTQILNVPKQSIRPALILYPDLIEEKCINFWARKIRLSKSQFYKTQFIQGKHPTKRLPNGICMIICNNRQLKEKVLVWIDLLSKTL